MQINNNIQMQGASKPNFMAIKSVKCEGLYKKFPEQGKILVDTFKNNPVAMEFCKKYDVDIVFYACKDATDSVRSSMHIFFQNPAKTKFLGIFGSKKDKIELSGFGNSYFEKESIKDSTSQLVDYMLVSTEGKPLTGVLNQHMKLKSQEIEKTMYKDATKR